MSKLVQCAGVAARQSSGWLGAGVLACLLAACSSSPPPACPCGKDGEPSVATLTVPPVSACPSASPAPEPVDAGAAVASPPEGDEPEAPAAPVVIGAARGGPRGVRPCEFRESVDAYRRSCTVKQNPDGSLTVTAPGTALNPAHGFSLQMGGGPNAFDVTGQLDAFGICRGPFTGRMVSVLDGAQRTYEVRFREHCMIVIR